MRGQVEMQEQCGAQQLSGRDIGDRTTLHRHRLPRQNIVHGAVELARVLQVPCETSVTNHRLNRRRTRAHMWCPLLDTRCTDAGTASRGARVCACWGSIQSLLPYTKETGTAALLLHTAAAG